MKSRKMNFLVCVLSLLVIFTGCGKEVDLKALSYKNDFKYDSYDNKGYLIGDYKINKSHSIIEDVCEQLRVEYTRLKKN